MLSNRISGLSYRGLARAAHVCGAKQNASKFSKLSENHNVVKSSAVVFRSFSSVNDPSTPPKTEKKGLIDKLWGFDSNVASESFKSRWLMVVPAFVNMMAIGAPYAWSLMADVVTREHGFISSAASDWNLMQAAMPVSLVFAAFGFSAPFFGKYQIEWGARKSLVLAALTFGGGFLMGSAGIYYHSLPLLYLGYGVLSGIGIGWGYTPAVQTLILWFPDKKGLASGLTIAGFGSGALVFTPCAQYLMKHFAKLPEYIGPASEVTTKTIDSKLFADVNGVLTEVVNAGSVELAKLSYSGLSEGLYAVGTGATGATETIAVMGLTYTAVILGASLALKKPHPNVAQSFAPVASSTSTAIVTVPDVTPQEVMKTSQFYGLGAFFFCVATGGLGIFSVAKPMMSEVFSAALPAVVTSAFASKYLLGMSAGNLGGRLGWGSLSDIVGRRNMFTIFGLVSIPLYASVPTLINNVVTTGESWPVYAFAGCTIAAVSIMGGTYAILPAYESDLYGTKFVGAIHGRMMAFSAMGSLAGPNLLFYLRSESEKKAVGELLTKIAPEKFEAVFGAPISQAYDLLAAKTVTISKLMVHMPPGTIDPTPFIYDSTMYTLSGLMCVAFLSHAMVKPMPTVPATIVDVKGVPPTLKVPAAFATPVVEEKVGDREIKK